VARHAEFWRDVARFVRTGFGATRQNGVWRVEARIFDLIFDLIGEALWGVAGRGSGEVWQGKDFLI